MYSAHQGAGQPGTGFSQASCLLRGHFVLPITFTLAKHDLSYTEPQARLLQPIAHTQHHECLSRESSQKVPPSHNVHCLIIIPHLGSPSKVRSLPSTAYQAHRGLLHALPASHQALPPLLLPRPHCNPTPGTQISQILMDSNHGLSLTLTQAECELRK